MEKTRFGGVAVLLALALGIAPGPDVLFVFAQALSRGAPAGTSRYSSTSPLSVAGTSSR